MQALLPARPRSKPSNEREQRHCCAAQHHPLRVLRGPHRHFFPVPLGRGTPRFGWGAPISRQSKWRRWMGAACVRGRKTTSPRAFIYGWDPEDSLGFFREFIVFLGGLLNCSFFKVHDVQGRARSPPLLEQMFLLYLKVGRPLLSPQALAAYPAWCFRRANRENTLPWVYILISGWQTDLVCKSPLPFYCLM